MHDWHMGVSNDQGPPIQIRVYYDPHDKDSKREPPVFWKPPYVGGLRWLF